MLKDIVWKNIVLPAWEKLEPLAEAKWEELKPQLAQWLRAEFQEWMPKVVEAAITAMTQVGVGIAASAAQKEVKAITDLIPGDVDDKLVNQFLGPIFDALRNKGVLPND